MLHHGTLLFKPYNIHKFGTFVLHLWIYLKTAHHRVYTKAIPYFSVLIIALAVR